MVDLLVVLLVVGGLLGGWHRGLLRELLVFVLWLPVLMLAASTLSGIESQADLQNQQSELWTLAGIFIAGGCAAFLIDRTLLRPWLLEYASGWLRKSDKFLGALFGAARIVFAMLAAFVLFYLYVGAPQFSFIQKSALLQTMDQQAQEIHADLIATGWFKQKEVVLYQRPDARQQEQQQLNDLLQGALGKAKQKELEEERPYLNPEKPDAFNDPRATDSLLNMLKDEFNL